MTPLKQRRLPPPRSRRRNPRGTPGAQQAPGPEAGADTSGKASTRPGAADG